MNNLEDDVGSDGENIPSVVIPVMWDHASLIVQEAVDVGLGGS